MVLDFSTGGGIGNALANIMTGSQYANALNGLDGDDLLNGNGGADTLLGGAGTDTLNGGGDRDTLNGGTGQDIMSGGTENDLYYVDDVGDQVLETAAAGTDSVEAVINYVLPVNVEAFSISGTVTGLTLTGNAADNLFLGKSSVQNDVLRGLAGDDTFQLTTNGSGEFSDGVTIEGGEGSDTLILSNNRNLRLTFTAVSESTGAGRDIINYVHFAPNLNNRFDFPTVPTSIAASVTIGSLDEGLFDIHLAQNIGAAQLGVGQALIFDPDQGDLANGHTFLIVDANGIAGYQAGGDYVVQIDIFLGTLTLDNFI